jgi:hypothetical protein
LAARVRTNRERSKAREGNHEKHEKPERIGELRRRRHQSIGLSRAAARRDAFVFFVFFVVKGYDVVAFGTQTPKRRATGLRWRAADGRVVPSGSTAASRDGRARRPTEASFELSRLNRT